MTAEFRGYGIDLSVEQVKKLETLTEFMLEYNRNVNLTRITERSEIIEKHYIDSILPLTMVDVPRGTKAADVGTGAGFPALPMKIYREDLDFTLIDSLGKRITYLEQACGKIGVRCRTIHSRGEDAGRDKALRESFGLVTARAVAALNTLCEYCLPLVEVGGRFVALKGEKDETDIAAAAIAKLGGELERVERYTLSGGDKRCIVVIRKISPTPAGYPRNSGAISKKPL